MLKLLLNDYVIAALILLNGVVLFADSFTEVQLLFPWLDKLDLVISGIFLTEMVLKVKLWGGKLYWQDSWNRLDVFINFFLMVSFILVMAGEGNFFFLTVLRLIRLAKFFRVLRFVPKIDHLLRGIQRALRASVFVFLAFFLYLFIVSVLSCFFFREVCPEHFGNPFLSLYSTFKIFTVEGWYELPELISQQYGPVAAFGVKVYFIFLVLTGGIFGISLVNAVFVDELVSDNNDEVLARLNEIQAELKELKNRPLK